MSTVRFVRRFRTCLYTSVMGAALLTTGPSQASEVFLNANESSASVNAFSDISQWVDSNGTVQSEWNSAAGATNTVDCLSSRGATTYVKRVLRTPAAATTFAGGVLQLWGNYNNSKDAELYVETTDAAGVSFPKGIYLRTCARIVPYAASRVYLNADIVTAAEDSGTVSGIKVYGSNYDLTLTGKLTGTKGSSASFKHIVNDASYVNSTIRYLGDLSEYKGMFDIETKLASGNYTKASDSTSLRLLFGSGTMNGTIYPHNNSTKPHYCAATFGINAATDVFYLKNFGKSHSGKDPDTSASGNFNFSLQYGMQFEFPVDAENNHCGQFKVFNSMLEPYTMPQEVVIRLTGDACVHDGATARKYATLSVVKSANAPTLDASWFTLDLPSTPSAVAANATLTIEETTDGDVTYQTVFVNVPAGTAETVLLLTSDPATHSGDNVANNAFTDATKWSDGYLPRSGYAYEANGSASLMVMRTTNSKTADWVFGGDTLALYGNTRIITQGKSMTIPQLHVYDGDDASGKYTGFYTVLNSAATTAFNGENLVVHSGVFNFGCFQNNTMNINAPISGAGTVGFSGMYIADNAIGYYNLNGDNSAFTGKFIVRQKYTDSSCKPTYTEDYPTLSITNANALGGAMSEFTADALTLKQYARLRAKQSLTLSGELNRGITVTDAAVLKADTGVNFTIAQPIALNGTLYIDSDGAVSLTGTVTPSSEANKVIVTNGVLQLANTTALAGVKVALGANAAVAVSRGLAGDNGAQLDLSNFELSSELNGRFPITVDVEAATRQLTADTATDALYRVNSAAMDAFRANFTLSAPAMYANAYSYWKEIDNGDGTITIALVSVKKEGKFLETNDSTSHSINGVETAFQNKDASWSPSGIPAEGDVVWIDGTSALKSGILWSQDATGSYTFPGESLNLIGKTRLVMRGATFTCEDLQVWKGYNEALTYTSTSSDCGIYTPLSSASTLTVNGNITVNSGAFRFGGWQDHTIVIAAALHGYGTIKYSGMWLNDNALCTYKPTAVNSDFFGKMILSQPYREGLTATPPKVLPLWNQDYSKLVISRWENLGAALSTATADALTITDFGRLRPAGGTSVTIPAACNRGITVVNDGIFDASSSNSALRIETPLTVNGNAYVAGVGSVTLAGAMTAVNTTDTLAVSNTATLVLANSDAVKGLAKLGFGAGTSLALEIASLDERGIDLVGTDIELDATLGGKLPLVKGTLAESSTRRGKIALFTVATEDKDAFAAMLPTKPPKLFQGVSVSWSEPIDNGDGTTTFAVEKNGAILFIY